MTITQTSQGREGCDTQNPRALGSDLPTAIHRTDTKAASRSAANLVQGQKRPEAQRSHALDSTLEGGHVVHDAQSCSASLNTLDLGHRSDDAHSSAAEVIQLPTSHTAPEDQSRPAGGDNLDGSHLTRDTHPRAAPVSKLDNSQIRSGAHPPRAVVETSPAASQGASDTQKRTAGGGSHRDHYLGLLADSLDDLEGLRIATQNRVRQLTRTEVDKDGIVRGFGLDERSPEVAVAVATLDGIKALEHEAELNLKRRMRKHPIYPWVKASRGVGEKQAGRLLALIGDPYWNDLYDRPRTVSDLWAYCGYAVIGGAAQKRRKGVKSNWSSEAKSAAYLIAEAIVKAAVRTADKDFDESEIDGYPVENRVALSDLGQLYLDRRALTRGRVHATDCVRCGPSGKPALSGSSWSGAHQQADALRVVAKEVLKQMWVASRDAREVAS